MMTNKSIPKMISSNKFNVVAHEVIISKPTENIQVNAIPLTVEKQPKNKLFMKIINFVKNWFK